MDPLIFQKIKKRIDSYRDEMIRLQMELTAIPALSPENGGDGESKKAEYLIAFLERAGFKDIETVLCPDERVSSGHRPNLFVRVPGKSGTTRVWILTHLDVVPPGERRLWKEDPYRAYVEDGRIVGRGTEDNQQDLVASLFTAKAFLDEKIIPNHSIGLAFVADEESSSKMGLQYVLRTARSLFSPRDLIVAPDAGNDEGTMIEVAEKSLLWVRFKTTGRQCHASLPSLGRNAFLAASHLVVKLNSLYRIFDVADPLYRPPVSTFEPTRKDANVPNVNTIPGEDIFYMDCRVLPSYPLDRVLGEMRLMADDIEKAFQVTVDLSIVQEVQAPPPTPPDAPIVRALNRAVLEVYGVDARPAGIGGSTVAAFFRKEGFQAAVWSRIGCSAHQPNEWCVIDNMIGNAKVYAHLCLQE
jgi:succinyl-diaminopimelate desuccinylase